MAEGSDTDPDALRRLEERLDRAAAAAERLLADAVTAAGSSRASGNSGTGSDSGSGLNSDGSEPDSGGGGAERPPWIPPAGWQQRASDEDPGHRWAGGEFDLLLAVLASVRDRIPPELQQRLADAVREVLLAVRAVIDWYLERTESSRAEPREVQDIPIL